MKKIAAKQIDVSTFSGMSVGSGGTGGGNGTNVTFDSYHLENGNLVVTKTTPLITSQSVVNGELIITVG